MDSQILDQLYRDWLIHISRQRQNGMISDRLDLTPVAMFIDFCHDKLEKPKKEQPALEVGDIVTYSPVFQQRYSLNLNMLRRGKVFSISKGHFLDGTDLVDMMWDDGETAALSHVSFSLLSKGSSNEDVQEMD